MPFAAAAAVRHGPATPERLARRLMRAILWLSTVLFVMDRTIAREVLTAIRRHCRRWALLLILSFALGAIAAPANACAKALSDAEKPAAATCIGCGSTDDPDQDAGSCAMPCLGSFVPVSQVNTPVDRLAAAAVLALHYSYDGWAAPPLIPPPRTV